MSRRYWEYPQYQPDKRDRVAEGLTLGMFLAACLMVMVVAVGACLLWLRSYL